MAGMLRKMGEYFGFSGTEYDLDDEYTDEYGEYAPAYAPQRGGYQDQGGYEQDYQAPQAAPARQGRFSSSVQVQQPRQPQRAAEPQRRPAPAQHMPAEQPVQIRTIHPTSYNDAKQMGELVRNGQAVIMNLSEMNDELARRLVDFGAGLTFGLGGSIDRVTHRVFLMSPPNVSVSAEDRARIAEGGFFNQS